MSDGARERGKTITQTPPAKSRLALYVAHFEQIDADGPPLWEHPDKDIRAWGVAAALKDGPRLCALPFALARNELVVPALHDMGMPIGRREAWLDALLDAATTALQTTDALDRSRCTRVPQAKRGGHPAAKLWPAAVIHAAYLDALAPAPSLRDNRRFEAVALRLGPGVDRDHVRRVVKSFRRRLGSIDAERRNLVLLAVQRVAGEMRKFDLARPPKAGPLARKLASRQPLLSRKA